MRSTLQDFANSSGPQRLGLCGADLPRLAEYVNEAQQRLINVAGEDGFWGGWARVAFNVLRDDPYLTLPTKFARVINADVCRTPIRIQNSWYEMLEAGIGLRTPCDARNGCGVKEAYDRGSFSTAYDLTPTNQKLRVYITDARDINKRIMFSGARDQNGNGVYSQDVQYSVIGVYLTFNQPFVTSAFIISGFDAVLKDQTFGDVILKQVDQTTGAEVFLARYGPDDTAPVYRRYLFGSLPLSCCTDGEPTTPAQVTCLAKLEFRPASRPTDLLIIGNIPALIEECASLRHGRMDDPTAKAMAIREHQDAVRLLNQELGHYLGKSNPAIVLAPWGVAKLERQMIGTLM